MPTTMTNCRHGSCSFHTEGSGMHRMAMSVAMLMAEEKYQMVRVSRQEVAIVGTMTPMGRQARLSRAACVQAQRQTTAMAPRQMRWMSLSWKMRRHWKRKPNLTTFMPML